MAMLPVNAGRRRRHDRRHHRRRDRHRHRGTHLRRHCALTRRALGVERAPADAPPPDIELRL